MQLLTTRREKCLTFACESVLMCAGPRVQRFRRPAQYMTKAELPESVMEQPDVVKMGVERVRVASFIVVTGAVRRA